MKEEKKNTIRYLKFVIICLVIILVLGATYALMHITFGSNRKNIISIGKYGINITGEKDNIVLSNSIPITDSEGVNSQQYIFQVNNDGDYKLNYKLLIVDSPLTVSEARMSDSAVKYILTKDGVASEISILGDAATYNNKKSARSNTTGETVNSRIIDSGSLDKNTSIDYGVQFWLGDIAENVEQNTEFSVHVEIDSTQYLDEE